jgi:hypothetical protein
MKMNSLKNLVTENKKSTAESKLSEKKLTEENLDPVYNTIMGIISGFNSTGMISKSRGYCLGVSDLMQKTLFYHGVKSKLVECKLSVMFKNVPEMIIIGHNDSGIELTSGVDEMSTHVVVITETEIPYLIDLSIGNIDKEIPYIVKPLNNPNNVIPCISEFEFDNSTWTYHEKQNKLLPKLHETSILNRIKTDNQIKKDIVTFKIFLIILSTITGLNFLRGIYDFSQKYINKTNGFGPIPDERVIK